MLTVILGAGASAGSCPPEYRVGGAENEGYHSIRPPLARELIEERRIFRSARDAYRQSGSLIAELRARLTPATGLGLEEELDRIEQESSGDPGILRQLIAFRFYLRQAIWNCEVEWNVAVGPPNNYAHLCQVLARWHRETDRPVTLLNFNYDMLADGAIQARLGLPLDSFESYVSHETYKYVKPHGSLKWGRWYEPGFDPSESDVVSRIIESFDPTRLRSEFVPNVAGPGDVVRADSRCVLPALAIPTTGKAGFECPTEHVTVLAECLAATRVALIIGWRATESHFLNEWKDTGSLERVVIACRSRESSDAVKEKLRAAGLHRGTIGYSALEDDFTTLLRRDDLLDLLNA